MLKFAIAFCCLVHIALASQPIKEVNKNNSSAAVSGEKYKILCWLPIPIKSHHLLVEPLLRELAKIGHRITLVTPIPMTDPPSNLNQIVIQNHYGSIQNASTHKGWFFGHSLTYIQKCMLEYVEGVFKDPAVQEFLNSHQEFDGIIMESLTMNEPFAGLQHKYNAPIIEVLALPHYHWAFFYLGIPYDTSYITDVMVAATDRMTFGEKLKNTVMSAFIRATGSLFLLPAHEELLNRYLRYPGWEERPRLSNILGNISLVLINSHFSISYPTPMPPHAKEIAGIHIPPPKPLPKDLQDWMDAATDGVIVFSLGSHLSMAGSLGDLTQIFKHVFSSVKLRVLWKWDGADASGFPANVKLAKWLPQSDILAHKNSKLFITHCGFHSSVETIYHGVPVVGIPIQGDQRKNCKMLAHHEIGLVLSLDNVTEDTLAWSIGQVLDNKMYKDNALKRSLIYRDKIHSPLDTAVFWTEYVLRHKGAHHLKPASAIMPWYQHALLDVYATLTAALIAVAYILYLIISFSFRSIINCMSKRNVNEGKKKN